MRVSQLMGLSLLLAATMARAQGNEISLAVLPFGALPTASAGRQAGPSLGEEAVGVATASGLYTVVDRSTDRAIEQELQRAESFRNFDSRVQLKTTGALNAAVLLIGVVEHHQMQIERPTARGERPSYNVTLGVRVKLVHTTTGEIIKSALFTLRNRTGATSAVEEKFGKVIPKALQDAVARELDKQVAGAADRAGMSTRAHTPNEAMQQAIGTLKKPLGEFLESSYAAVMRASKQK